MTRVVHCKKSKYDVYIGRPSKWGNPFTIGVNGSRLSVIELYRKYFYSRPDLMKAAEEELKDKVLGCWCAPLPCHGDVIAEYLREVDIRDSDDQGGVT